MTIIIDSWYSDCLEYKGLSFQSWLESQFWYPLLSPVIFRIGILKGILLFMSARHKKVIVIACDTPGFWTFLFLRALFKKSGKCFVLEFIRRKPMKKLKKMIYPIWFNFIVLPSVRRGVSLAQVMTSWEVNHYAKMFGISPKKFIHIPFPMHHDEPYSPVPKVPIQVMSSGRQSCDWETLLKVVASLPQYRFLIIYYRKDKKKFQKLKIPSNCDLLSDIPQYVHDRLLERSVCYVITLLESMGSSGHVRLSYATHLKIPVIITDVVGIREYVIDEETALIIPPNDPLALKQAIERLMSDPTLQKKISNNAKKNSMSWTRHQYFKSLSLAINQLMYN